MTMDKMTIDKMTIDKMTRRMGVKVTIYKLNLNVMDVDKNMVPRSYNKQGTLAERDG